MELKFIYSQHELISIQVVVVYKSPSSPFSSLIKNFEKELLPRVDQSKPLVIIGDFNIDIQQKMTTIEQLMFERFGCKQLMDSPTTDNGSIIDLFFQIILVKLEQKKPIGQIISCFTFSHHNFVHHFSEQSPYCT